MTESPVSRRDLPVHEYLGLTTAADQEDFEHRRIGHRIDTKPATAAFRHNRCANRRGIPRLSERHNVLVGVPPLVEIDQRIKARAADLLHRSEIPRRTWKAG